MWGKKKMQQTARSLIATMLVVAATCSSVYGQTTIGGKIYTGARTAGSLAGGAQPPMWKPIYHADDPGKTPKITDAQVMVQNQHSGGAWIAYGTMGPSVAPPLADNEWQATVPTPAPGDSMEYVIMFSAPGHDLTSREVTVYDDGSVAYLDPSLGLVAGKVQYSSDKKGIDAYLPKLYTDPETGASAPDELPPANLLVFAFYDNYVNGEPDDYPEDIPLNGVTWTVKDEDGAVLATGVTGSQASITLPDGTVITNTDGLYYFTGLPPGEVIVTSAADKTHLYPQPAGMPTFTASTEFYLDYTEEGGPAWDPKLYPGDPGVEDGGFMLWHGYVEKLGQLPPGPGTGTIEGRLVDADGAFDVVEPEDALVALAHPGVSANDFVPDGLIILFTDQETGPVHPVATTEATPSGPDKGKFKFENVPPGRYKMMCFDVPLDYVWVQQQVTVPTGGGTVTVEPWVPRFFGRTQGYVYDTSTPTPTPVAGATVHMRLKDGSIWKTTTTDPSGWYNFDDLPEVEVLGYVDVDLTSMPGYRGAMKTFTFYPDVIYTPDPVPPPATCDPSLGAPYDPISGTFPAIPCVTPGAPYITVQNAMSRYVQWYTANYRADLYVEPVPAAKGDIRGFVFNDHLARGTWVGDGAYDADDERTLHGVTVELWSDPPGAFPIATTTTGKFSSSATNAQGWVEPYTYPPDEWGGVFAGPLPGFYEFRDLAPGSYTVKVIPPPGYSASPPGSDVAVVSVTIGTATEHSVGFNTTPPAASIGVPLAGEIEGGVFDDLNVDPRGGPGSPRPDKISLLYMEKAGIPGVPVGVYDHLGYLLGAGYMGNPLCFSGSPVGNCPAGEDPVQKPEVERRFAPSVHLYYGNDPTLPNYCENYAPLLMTYEFGQGKFKFEADWSLIPTALINIDDQCAPFTPLSVLPGNAPVINNPLAPVVGKGNPATISSPAITVNPKDVIRIHGRRFGDQQGYSHVILSGRRLKAKEWTDRYIDVEIHKEAISGPLVVATSTGISNALPIEVNYDTDKAQEMSESSVFVDASNTGPQDGSKANPWKTINEALDHLPDTDRRYVFVAAGTYRERIQIKEDRVYLIGSGPLETILDGSSGYGPVIFLGDGEDGSDKKILISGFTITGGSVKDDIGAGIFSDYGNKKIIIDANIIAGNGGYYGGGIWMHKSNHTVEIHSNIIAGNGNYGGYGGGISVNDEPEYEEEHGQPEHIGDDLNPGPPPGTYLIYNNLIYHNYSPDYGGAMALYELKDHLKIFGNMIVENKAEDHGGAIFFEDCGPVDLYANVFLRNFCYDDGGAVSFEDVGDTLSHVYVYNNLFAENIADDHGENHARGGALAFDDTFYGEVYSNTFAGNIVAGSYNPAGGAIDSERNGHEYNGTDGPYMAPGYSDPKIYNNIIWKNWRLTYTQPGGAGEEEDLDYTWGENYVWTPDELHVDNPHLQPEWESHNNSESFSHVEYNVLRGGYSAGANNMNIRPRYRNPARFNWRLKKTSPVLDSVPEETSPRKDLQRLRRLAKDEPWVEPGAYDFRKHQRRIVRIPTGIMGSVRYPTPGSSSLTPVSLYSGNDSDD